MSEPQIRSHAEGGPPRQDIPAPSLAERAKTLTTQGGASTLSTLSRKHPGYPFGSVMPYGLTPEGEPIFLISSMATHTHNLLADPRATLLIMQQAESASPLGSGRVSLMGEAVPLADTQQIEAAGRQYLMRHPEAKHWKDFGDFQYFRMKLVDVYFIGGFGVMGWVAADDFRAAEPDPLAPHAEGILQHMNEDHGDAMVTLAKYYQGLEALEANMTSVDRLGFHLRVLTPEGVRGVRIAFPEAVASQDALRASLVAMVKLARGSAP